jgi:hypothetical protein
LALIKDALSALPARPAMLAAPLIIIVVLSLYYWDLRDKCIDIKQVRESLYQRLTSMPSGVQFRLADFTDFEWNRVRIVASVAPGTISDECHLDWNWAAGERESLIETGDLSVLIFGHRGRVVGYYELRRDRIAFAEIDDQLTPEKAIFDVARVPAGGRIVSLSLAAQDS